MRMGPTWTEFILVLWLSIALFGHINEFILKEQAKRHLRLTNLLVSVQCDMYLYDS